MPNLIPIFLTGLVTGGITCMAVQGGLLAGVLASTAGDDGTREWKSALPIIGAFVLAKTFIYTLLGAFLGAIGAAIQPSPIMTAVLLTIASLFMIATALNMLEVHPVFRFFAIQPPRALTRLVRQESKKTGWFAGFVVGLFTVFIPCGTTQAMMAAAMSTGTALGGALTMAAFILGTIPLFVVFGVLFQAASAVFTRYFAPVAATLVILLALWNLGNVSAITGVGEKVLGAARTAACSSIMYCEEADPQTAGQATTTPLIAIQANDYSVDNPRIKAGSQVTLTVRNDDGEGCIQAFTIPSLGIRGVVPVGTTKQFSFRAPEEKGDLPFMCSMGMFRGRLIVI